MSKEEAIKRGWFVGSTEQMNQLIRAGQHCRVGTNLDTTPYKNLFAEFDKLCFLTGLWVEVTPEGYCNIFKGVLLPGEQLFKGIPLEKCLRVLKALREIGLTTHFSKG